MKRRCSPIRFFDVLAMGRALMAKFTTTHLIKRIQHQVDTVNQSRHSALGKQKKAEFQYCKIAIELSRIKLDLARKILTYGICRALIFQLYKVLFSAI